MARIETKPQAPPAWRNRIVGHGDEVPDQLLANPRNWRIHPKAQQDALAGVLNEVGWVQEVIVNRTTGHVVDGHLRVSLAISREEPTIPVKYVELSLEEEALVLATLDPLAGMAATAKGALESLLADVTPASEAVAGLLEDVAKGAGLATVKEGLTDPDAVPEVTEPVSKRGDVWVCGEHRVMCGDSTVEEDVARLMAGEKAAAIIADPPYGMGLDTDYSWMKSKLPGKHQGGTYEPVVGDSEPFDAGVVRQNISAAEEFWFGADYYIRTLPEGGSWFVWDKRLSEDADRGFGSAFELVWSRQAHKRTFLRHRWFGYFANTGDAQEQQNRFHPTQKPTALIERLLADWGKGGSVTDPFLGSGTTMIAAERLGRRCYGMEIEPLYVDVAVRRWEAFTGQRAVRDA